MPKTSNKNQPNGKNPKNPSGILNEGYSPKTAPQNPKPPKTPASGLKEKSN